MQIRHKIFETNSSSTHTLVFKPGSLDYEAITIKNRRIEFCPQEYGWGHEKLETWYKKAEYMATYAAIYGTISDIRNFEKVVSDYIKVPVKIVTTDVEGYIDHQSVDSAAKMFQNLKETIFRPGIIFIDNDNDNYFYGESISKMEKK